MPKRPATKSTSRARANRKLTPQQFEARRVKRELKFVKSVARMSRQLTRAIARSDRSLRELVVFVQERDGDGPLQQLAQINTLLEQEGEIRDGMTVFEAVQRLVISARLKRQTIDEFSQEPAVSAGEASRAHNDTRPGYTVHETFTLSRTAYAVFRAVPSEWWEERSAVTAIAEAAGRPVASVLKSLDYLVRLKLVERRTSPQISARREIRKRP